MVRFVAKGGIWKNSEDEILKAAVMKYGKNQWARVSSLLVRKTAKQCKARWYEWLDPSIRKTAWTRDEEEKLLHLAKLMPTQWRTIAPLVGRTATQCLEHYNRLLDAAQAREAGVDTAPEGGEGTDAADPRRLRPGEVDPLPEARPARPDAVDMDEDEKEMLSEARARLANTRGKKAKRKAREKALREARRLAVLQKQRELKAAGIATHARTHVTGIDYNREVPFARRAPAGVFAVPAAEAAPPPPLALAALAAPRPDQLDAPRRDVRARAARAAAAAAQHDREARDLPAVVAQQNAAAAAAMERARKKARLVLPAPQVAERELAEIARLDSAAAASSADVLGNDGRTPAPALLASAATGAGVRAPTAPREALLHEAQNLLRLTHAATPLVGGANPVLHPSDFAGATPRHAPDAYRTPNPLLATVAAAAAAAADPTGATPLPVHDAMQINRGSGAAGAAVAHARRVAQRREFEARLAALPAPLYRYRVTAPAAPAKEGQGSDSEEEEEDVDASDAGEQEARAEGRAARALRAGCSAALQRGLPRLTRTAGVTPLLVSSAAEGAEDAVATRLVGAAMRATVAFELHHFGPAHTAATAAPFADARTGASTAQQTAVGPAALHAAAALIAREAETEAHKSTEPLDVAAWGARWTAAQRAGVVYAPGQHAWVCAGTLDAGAREEAQEARVALLDALAARQRAANDRLAARLGAALGAHAQRVGVHAARAEAAGVQLAQARLERACCTALRAAECRAIPARIADARAQLEAQEAIERSLQQRYAALHA